MAAYVFADVEVTDPTGFQEYQSQVGGTLTPYGGKFIIRGGRTETLEGDYQPHRLVVVEFPTYEQARAWYDSPGYAPLIPMRLKTSNTVAFVVDGV